MRHFIEQTRLLAGSVYGRCIYEVMRYWDDDHPEWDDDERAFAAAWCNQAKWVVSRSLKSVGPNAVLVTSRYDELCSEPCGVPVDVSERPVFFFIRDGQPITSGFRLNDLGDELTLRVKPQKTGLLIAGVTLAVFLIGIPMWIAATPKVWASPGRPGGNLSFYNNSGTVNLVADLVGRFTPSSSLRLRALTPARLLDTRDGHPLKLLQGGDVTTTSGHWPPVRSRSSAGCIAARSQQNAGPPVSRSRSRHAFGSKSKEPRLRKPAR